MLILNRQPLPFLVLKPKLIKEMCPCIYIVHAHSQKETKACVEPIIKALDGAKSRINIRYVSINLDQGPMYFFPSILKIMNLFYRGGDITAILRRVPSWSVEAVQEYIRFL